LSHDSALHGFTKSINKFADMSDYEFAQMKGYKRELRANKTKNVKLISEVGLPASVDWVAAGAVTPIKDQGQCGACWAFSTTGSIEGVEFINTGKLISLSEQQLVDCSKAYGNMGCNGGLMDNAFKYTEKYELETEAEYPYTAAGGTCAYKATEAEVGTSSYHDVTQDSPSQLLAAVAQQPVSVAIEADKAVFQSYTGGIITSSLCGTSLDHGVLVVGYGSEAGQDYWKLKNSWGTTWGEAGYFRILRSTATGPGICGLQEEPSYPTQ